MVDPVVDDHRFTATLSGSIQPLLGLLARHRVSSMLVEEPDLEEAFLDLYEGSGMNARMLELVAGPLRAIRRATFWWTSGSSRWSPARYRSGRPSRARRASPRPSTSCPPVSSRHSASQDFGTPAGFLRGNLYDFFVPLLLAVAAVVLRERPDRRRGGRRPLELYLAQPLDRRAVTARGG